MESKIQELTDKLFREGVEKGNEEAQRIVEKANGEAAGIVKNAQKEAEEIVAAAEKKAAELLNNTKKELGLYAGQTVNALKSEVANCLTDNVVSDAVKGLVDDKDFLCKFAVALAEKWAADETVVISSAEAETLKSYFASKAKGLLDKGVKIEQVNGQKALFTIAPADGSYKVNFGTEEFEKFFKSFLRPQLVEMLFNK